MPHVSPPFQVQTRILWESKHAQMCNVHISVSWGNTAWQAYLTLFLHNNNTYLHSIYLLCSLSNMVTHFIYTFFVQFITIHESLVHVDGIVNRHCPHLILGPCKSLSCTDCTDATIPLQAHLTEVAVHRGGCPDQLDIWGRGGGGGGGSVFGRSITDHL